VFDSLTTTVRHTRFESNVATVTAGAVATTNIVDTIANARFSDHATVSSSLRPRFQLRVQQTTSLRGDQAAHDAFQWGGGGGVNFPLGGGASGWPTMNGISTSSIIVPRDIGRKMAMAAPF